MVKHPAMLSQTFHYHAVHSQINRIYRVCLVSLFVAVRLVKAASGRITILCTFWRIKILVRNQLVRRSGGQEKREKIEVFAMILVLLNREAGKKENKQTL
jgi:hypothetical protein